MSSEVCVVVTPTSSTRFRVWMAGGPDAEVQGEWIMGVKRLELLARRFDSEGNMEAVKEISEALQEVGHSLAWLDPKRHTWLAAGRSKNEPR